MSRDTVSVGKQLGNGEDAVIMFTLESRWSDMMVRMVRMVMMVGW